jgi:hypothetical protein
MNVESKAREMRRQVKQEERRRRKEERRQARAVRTKEKQS